MIVGKIKSSSGITTENAIEECKLDLFGKKIKCFYDKGTDEILLYYYDKNIRIYSAFNRKYSEVEIKRMDFMNMKHILFPEFIRKCSDIYLLNDRKKMKKIIDNSDEFIQTFSLLSIIIKKLDFEIFRLYIEKFNIGNCLVSKNMTTVLHIAVKIKKIEYVKYFCKEYPWLVNIYDKNGVYPIHIACDLKYYRINKILIKYRSEIMCYSFNGVQPIHLIIKNDDIKSLNLFVKNGCNYILRYRNGYNVSDYAVLYGSLKCLVYFVERKIYPIFYLNLEDKMIDDYIKWKKNDTLIPDKIIDSEKFININGKTYCKF